ncbi:hypothetical protein [Halovenus marina]|uniref:hypothetical protein n=1 Tax=Halovenus marina TaxID=3396621 RepID=UPI003F5729D2
MDRPCPKYVPDLKTGPCLESKTLDHIGFYYACYAHHDDGMRGSVIVRDDESRWEFTETRCGDLSVTAHLGAEHQPDHGRSTLDGLGGDERRGGCKQR